MRYLSLCSGIEAASVAWQHMGWQAAGFSEIEPFPSAVLAHHYPNVPNLGDMTQYKEWSIGTVDLLVGGTPCQSFSVAGLRKGLADPRGNLALTYLAIAEATRARWIVWENVPGVLSSNKGRDFGAFLGALAELGYGFAYRVLDAQWFGVAQRRRRVFVVGYLGDWRRAAAVLFERESLRRDTAPSREAGQKVAPTVVSGPPFSRTGNERVECDAIVAQCLTSGTGKRYDVETETILPVSKCFQQNTRDEVRYIGGDGQIAGALAAESGMKQTNYIQQTMAVRRLTPVECERLQGFPDNYTNIPWRKKDEAPDGPRYKALGNSMAVPVMRWIGERINKMERKA